MEQQDVISDDLVYFMAESKGWLKSLGIISIISGIVSFLSVFGIIIAWLPLWQGFLLLHSANKTDDYIKEKSEIQLKETLKPIRTYFIIQTVLMGLSILSLIVIWIFVFATGMWMKMGLKSFMQ